MKYENRTLGELLRGPRISLIAPDAIRNRDLSKEKLWNRTLLQIKEDGIRGDVASGLERLYSAAETGEWYYPFTVTRNARRIRSAGVSISSGFRRRIRTRIGDLLSCWFPGADLSMPGV